MNLPQVYTCSPSWIPLPPPSPYHPFMSSQCTSPEHPISCIEPGLTTHFTYDIIHVSIPFSQILPPSPSPTESIRLFYTSVSLLLSLIQGYRYHLSKFHIYALVYCIGVFLSGLLHSVPPPTRCHSLGPERTHLGELPGRSATWHGLPGPGFLEDTPGSHQGGVEWTVVCNLWPRSMSGMSVSTLRPFYSAFFCLVLQGRWKPKILPTPNIPDLTHTPSYLVYFTQKVHILCFPRGPVALPN